MLCLWLAPSHRFKPIPMQAPIPPRTPLTPYACHPTPSNTSFTGYPTKQLHHVAWYGGTLPPGVGGGVRGGGGPRAGFGAGLGAGGATGEPLGVPSELARGLGLTEGTAVQVGLPDCKHAGQRNPSRPASTLEHAAYHRWPCVHPLASCSTAAPLPACYHAFLGFGCALAKAPWHTCLLAACHM